MVELSVFQLNSYDSRQQESFLALKERLTTAPILAIQIFPSYSHCIPTLVGIVLDLTSLRYSMVKNEPLSMADGTFQARRRSTLSQNEKYCQ